MKKLRFVHLITRLDKGGSAENTFLTAREFVKKGHSVQIWTGPDVAIPRNIKADAKREGIELIFIPSLVRSIQPIKDLICLIQLIRFLKREKPEILHTHTSKAGFLGRLAGKLAGIRCIVHTPHGHVFYAYFGSLKTNFYILLERLAAHWTDVIIPLSKRGAREYLQRKIGRKEQYFPVVSGIDLSLLDFSNQHRESIRKKLKLSDSTVLIGGIGRFVPVKGLDLFVELIPKVLAKYPDVKFYLVGDGPMKPQIKAKIKEYKIQKNIFMTSFQEISAPLQAIDILVVPSRNEGQSRTLVEGMLLKKGVIATQVGGIPDVVEQGKTGLLVPSEDVEALAQAIISLLKNKNKIKTLGQAACQSAKKRFALEQMIQSLENVYAKVYQQKITSHK